MKEPRFVYKDVPTDEEFIGMMKEINQRPCVIEPRIEKSVNKAEIEYSYSGAYQDFIAILIHNGYEISARKVVENGHDKIVVTWKDKGDF